jgi:formylglycine-generating enzyme required for sulfatase activity
VAPSADSCRTAFIPEEPAVANEVNWTLPGPGQASGPRTEGLTTLPPGSRIGKYEVMSVLGQGGFGITYRARDTQLGRDVAIKEYLPTTFAARQSDSMVLPHSTQLAEDFRWGRERFLAEAKTLAQLEHAVGIVNVYDFLEANGTAYMVMALVPGETLEARLARDGRLTQPAIERLLYPLLDGLERVHRAGFLHRDIKPANILVDNEGAPALIDFGASRIALRDRTQAMTAIYTPGYAAFEQMSSAPQGPWTDIYALAGTLYHCIAGMQPPPAMDRMINDRLVPAVEVGRGYYAPSLLAAIDAGLALNAEARPQSIPQWRALFSGMGTYPGAMPGTVHLPPGHVGVRRRRRWLWPAVAAAVVLCLAGGTAAFFVMQERARVARELAEADERAWVQAKATNTEAAYQDYVSRYPQGLHAGEARQALAAFEQRRKADEDAWARAKGGNTEAAYRDYIKANPGGRFVADAQREIERLRAEARLARERELERIETDTWARAKAAGTEAGYQAYLDRYPQGRFAAEARSEIQRARRVRSNVPFRDCEQCPEMLMVRRGSFMMGAPPGEEERERVPNDRTGWSSPQVRVTFKDDFAVGKYPVTRAEFAKFVAATGHSTGDSCLEYPSGGVKEVQGKTWRNPRFPQGDRHPVVCVSLEDAQAYAKWLKQVTGKEYRLLSSSEWEYVARAGTTTARYWGDGIADACKHANVGDLSLHKDQNLARSGKIFPCTDGFEYTAAVDFFPPNPWGFHDMLGNVYTWTTDCGGIANYEKIPTDGRPWEEGGNCARRQVRGGSWAGSPWLARAAARSTFPVSTRDGFIGFRVARSN